MSDIAKRGSVDLDAIRARAESATPGPWKWDDDRGEILSPHRCDLGCKGDKHVTDYDGSLLPHTVIETDGGYYLRHKPDREFIAHARADVPALLAMVETMTRALVAVHAINAPEADDARDVAMALIELYPEVDAALTAAGLDTAEKREAKRAEKP